MLRTGCSVLCGVVCMLRTGCTVLCSVEWSGVCDEDWL